MNAVMSSGTSPVSGFSVPLDEDDESQSWTYIEAQSFDDSHSGEMVFPAPSPSIVSQGSWNVVQTGGQALTTPSPVMSQNAGALSTSPFAGAATFGPASTTSMDHGTGAMGFEFTGLPLASQQHTSEQQFVTEALLNHQVASLAPQNFVLTPQDMIVSGFGGFDAVSMMPDSAFGTLEQQAQFSRELGIPLSMQGHADVEPWDPTSMQQGNVFVTEQVTPPPPRSDGSSSISLSPRSPASPAVKQDPHSSASKKHSTNAIQKVPKKPAGVQKTQKKKTSTSSRSASDSPDQSSKIRDGMLMFCNQTVDTWGKPHLADVENIERSSQKGRKGALSEEVRANALKVRQAGACFCCHIRKVKCDEQRPCKNCVKLCAQVPEAVCWKFPDFTEILFPEFLRGHFRRDEMARFIRDNVASFTIGGAEVPARGVVLSSGPHFGAKLVVNAKFFTARDAASDINTHYYHFVGERGVDLEALRAAPIGLDLADGAAGGSQRGELRRKVEAYVDALVAEPGYAAQTTDSIWRTAVPRRVLGIVQRYAARAPPAAASIVRRALAVYAMHYVMTRHLTMTPQSIASLQAVNPVAATGPFMTPRLLNRQIKTVVDDMMQHEISALFDDFSKRFKGKQKGQWAPCLAAFLVFCLVLEAIEAAADVFAITGNEVEIQNRRPARFMRSHALDINANIENMPFKQFAFQFHNIYQTHSRDASAKSFNPLFGSEGLKDLGTLDRAGLEMVLELRNLVQRDCKPVPFSDVAFGRGAWGRDGG